jgi:uracil phosphoribosyltransferase
MIDPETLEIKLHEVDIEAVQSLAALTGVSYEVAFTTYKLGLLLRYMALQELARKETNYTSKLHGFLRSDTLVRFTLLLLIPLLRAGYGPVLKGVSKLAR